MNDVWFEKFCMQNSSKVIVLLITFEAILVDLLKEKLLNNRSNQNEIEIIITYNNVSPNKIRDQ